MEEKEIRLYQDEIDTINKALDYFSTYATNMLLIDKQEVESIKSKFVGRSL